MSDTKTAITIGEDYPEIREAVKKICAGSARVARAVALMQRG